MHRSTTLNLLLRNCPRAVDHFDANTPIDRTQFEYGVAAHAVLQALIDHPDDDVTDRAEATVRELVTNGRTFYGQTEPPMHPEPATAGRDVALTWLARDFDGLDPAWVAEVMYTVDRDWNPCTLADPDAWLHAVIDVVGPCEYEDDDFASTGVTCRDWKGSYQTETADLDALQQKIQALLVAAHNPDAAFIRRQVVSLRTCQTFTYDLWLDEDGQATLAQWRRDVEHVCAQAEAVGDDGKRPARPGPCCGGCPYVLRCEDAQAGGALDGDVWALARNYSMLKATLDAMAPTLRHATADAPIEIDGHRIGYSTRERQAPTPETPATIAREWFAPDDWAAWERENADVLGLIAALKPGAGSVKALGKALYPGRGAARVDDFKDRRAALEAEALTTKLTTSFGVTSDGGEEDR